LRTYWELPAVAHFCSLFRSVFNLVDFDIEDLEDGLIIETESSAEGGRSSLIVDILVALLHGIVNKRSVSLLNYNQRLHEVLGVQWVSAGLGPNPLGIDREKASFHKLPLYPKLKLLHCLCEWRLEKLDVEALIKDFSGDSLRILPLGSDRNGLTYWYFYGTRLFCEEEELKIKISASYLSGTGKKNLEANDSGDYPMKEESMDTTPPSSVETPWDQPLLKAPEKTRWKLVCSTMEEWKQLAEKYENSRSEKEQSLYRVLTDDFLPAIETLFVEIFSELNLYFLRVTKLVMICILKNLDNRIIGFFVEALQEKEKARKMAELAPRRSSDRLEYKKLKQEQEDKILAEREAVEMERVAKLEQEKQRKMAAEQREQRAKLRQLERDKRQLLMSKAREERSQRLEMRKMRQEMLLQGKEIPAHLMNTTNDVMNDEELEEL
uniref:DDT domain-containing protein n=1 Tax=Romanomermis culicivorax TaxID=13658 RepID=A0A915JKA1_ROMCU